MLESLGTFFITAQDSFTKHRLF